MSRVYRMLLRLYRREYEVEFAQEMLAVFLQRASDRRSEGSFAYMRFLFRECCGVFFDAIRQQSVWVRVTPPLGGAAVAVVLCAALSTATEAVRHELTFGIGKAPVLTEDPRAAVFAVSVGALTTLLCLLPVLLLLSMRLLRRHR